MKSIRKSSWKKPLLVLLVFCLPVTGFAGQSPLGNYRLQSEFSVDDVPVSLPFHGIHLKELVIRFADLPYYGKIEPAFEQLYASLLADETSVPYGMVRAALDFMFTVLEQAYASGEHLEQLDELAEQMIEYACALAQDDQRNVPARSSRISQADSPVTFFSFPNNQVLVRLSHDTTNLRNLFKTIMSIDVDDAASQEFKDLYKRLFLGRKVAPYRLVYKAIESAYHIIDKHGDLLSSFQLEQIVKELNEYFFAFYDGAVEVGPHARAPRPGEQAGIEDNLQNAEQVAGQQQAGIGSGGGSGDCCPLPRDVTIDRNLHVGGDATIEGDIVVTNIIAEGGILLPEDPANGTDAIRLTAPDSLPASYTFTLPGNGGLAGQVLTTDGSGTTSWTAGGGGGGDINQGGNSFGAPITIGTNDNFALNLETNAINRLTIANTGEVSLASLAGIGDRIVAANAAGQLSAVAPANIKNKIIVSKDSPTVDGQYYSDIKAAVDWANANATEPTEICIAPGVFSIDTTITVTNSFLRCISGSCLSATVLVPTAGLLGTPMFLFNHDIPVFENFTLTDVTINGLALPAWQTVAGSTNIAIAGSGNFSLRQISMIGGRVGISLQGTASPLGQTVIINSCSARFAQEQNLLVDGGPTVIILDAVFGGSPNVQVLVRKTNALAPQTIFTLRSSIISNQITNTGTGFLIQDDAVVIVSGCIVTNLDDCFVVEDTAVLLTSSNEVVGGNITSYKQIDGTAVLNVAGDILLDTSLSQFLITNPANVSFDIWDRVTGDRKLGNFSTDDNNIFIILTGNGPDDPDYRFENNWFGHRGEVFEMPANSLTGSDGGMSVMSAFDNDMDVSALIRGATAHSFRPHFSLNTYQNITDPSMPVLTDLRSWELSKEPSDNRFSLRYFDGTTETNNMLVVDTAGNIGFGVAAPVAKLELDSGQIATPNGTGALPSYSFSSDLDTGMYLAGVNTLGFATAGACRLQISPTGSIMFPGLSPAGVVHVDGSGNLSSSLIVNADVAPAAAIADTKLATISTPGKVANSATTATSTNSPGTIVLRDGAGDFAAGTITASLIGNVTGAASDNVLKAGDTMTGPLTMADQNQIRLREDVVNGLAEVRLQAPANLTMTGGTYTLTFPGDDGAANQVLATNGSGVLSWTSVGAGNINNGGNSFGAPITLGTNDNFALNLETNGTDRIQIANTGEVTLTDLAVAAGVVHNSAAGLLTSSLIVNADVDAAAAIVDTKLDTISTAGKVLNSATTATALNTPSAIVARDVSGNFAANHIIIENQNRLCLRELAVNGTNDVGLRAPADLTAGYNLTFPVDAGSTQQVLTTNGLGDLTWTNVLSDGGISTGATVVVGTNDANNLEFETGGVSRVQIDTSGDMRLLNQGALCLRELAANGTDEVCIQAPAALGASYTLTLPVDDGTANQVLTTDGSGILSWTDTGAAAGSFVNNGNSFGGLATLGTNDNFGLNLETNGTDRIQIANSGTVTITNLAGTAGVVHNDAAGLLTSSLIVNADVDAAAAIVDTKLDTISTAGKVANSATTATALNTPSAIVARDGSGNFAAGTGTFETAIALEDPGVGTNTITLQAPTPLGASYILTLPADDGDPNQVLTTNGAGLLSWTDTGSAAGFFVNNGNSFSGLATLGTNDGFGLNLETSGIDRIQIASGGTVTITNLAGTAGVVHNDAAGLLTSSLIVNADVDAAAAIVDTKLATISTAGKVLNSATTATALNTPNAIVARDVSGNFAAGTGTFETAIALEDPGVGTNTITLQSPAPLGASYTLTLPSDDGLSQQVLTTNGSGILSWSNVLSDGGISTGATVIAGTNDANNLEFETGGTSRVQIDTSGNMRILNQGALCLREASGDGTEEVCLQAQAMGASYTLTLPADAGILGQFLTTNGSGLLSWSTPAGAGDINNGGNTFGTPIVIGTNDAFDLSFETAGVTRATFDTSGNFRLLNQGALCLREASGDGTEEVCLQAQAMGASYTLTLPADAGTLGQFLTTNGSGLLSWSTPAGAGDINNGGNTFGTPIIIGTNDNFDLNFETDGTSRVQIDTSGNMRILDQGALCLREASGDGTEEVCLQAQAMGASYTLTLPANAGAINQVLTTDGGGLLSWTTPVAGGDINDGGNSFGDTIVIGTNDNFGLNLETNGTDRIQIASGGAVTVTNLAGTAGVVHNDAAGLLTSSLIVNADVDAAAAIVDTKLDTISTAGKVLNSATTATALNTPSAIVARDGSGNFAAGTGTFETAIALEDPGVGTNTITLQSPAALGASYTLTLPVDDGTANQVLTTDGSGILSWMDTGAAAGYFVNNGNSFGGLATLGTNDGFGLNLETNGTDRIQIANSGAVTITNLAGTAGIVHSDAAGLLTSSLIVNADVDAAAAIVDTKLDTISTAGKVANSATTATALNTPSAIVARDGSGNFAAGTGTFETAIALEDPGVGTNTITLQSPAALGASYTLTLPVDDGTANQVLTTNGSGILSWTDTGAAAGYFVNNGNSFGGLATLGTNDNFGLNLETNGTDRIQIANSGAVTITNLAGTAGIVHNSAAGLLTSSLIVNADVDAAAAIVDTKLDTISTAGKVLNSATTATALNTPNAIVARDVSGNFAAGTGTFETAIALEDPGVGTNTITLQSPAALGASYTLTLPVDDGTANQVLTTNGAGVLSWTDTGAAAGFFVNNGNSFGGLATLGTNDDNGLNLETNGTDRIQIASGGEVTVTNLAGTAGVVHNSAAGLLTSSLIVNADVDAAAAIVDTKLDTISTAGKVLNSATTATALNTASAIVARDVSGNFAAHNITYENQGQVRLRELAINGADAIAIQAPAALAAGYTLTLPSDVGTANQVLTTDGMNPASLSWTTIAASGDINNGGNTFGAPITIGTNDAFALNLETSNTDRIQIASTGGVTITNLAGTAGIVHSSATGLLSSSLIVNADVDAAAAIVDTKLAIISTAGKVLNSATTATELNTPSAIVARDGSGNFAASTIILEDQGELLFREDVGNGINTVGVRAPMMLAADYTLTLPIDAGIGGQVLQTDGSGNLSWVSGADIPNVILDGGNTEGAPVTIGTNDNFGLNLETAGSNRIQIANNGAVTITNLAGTAGIVHSSSTGLLTSSLIVNADVAAGAAIVDTKLATISTAGKVANTATTATTANTPNTIVLRDGSGNFSAGTITATFMGNLTGNVTGAASANVLKAGDTMTGNLIMDNQRQVRFREATASGTNFAAIQAPASLTADYTLTLPVDDGTANQVLTTDGSGILSWTDTGSAAGYFINNGNSFGGLATLGTNDNFGLNLETNGTDRIQIANSGAVTITNLAGTAGVVHSDATGLLTSSLIVNADVDAAAAIVDTKLDTISTAGKVANSATTATSANTANAIVARDVAGNFSAGTITASLTGAASLNVLKAGDSMTGALIMDNQQQIRFRETTGMGTNFAAIQAPATLAADYTLTLPINAGTVGQVLSTNGSGVLSWITSGSGDIVNGGQTGPVTIGTNDATALELETSGTSRLFIDSSGNTTYTSNYKANARVGANQTITGTGTQTIQFNTEMYDPNSNFNTGTFLYTAPITGYYLVSVNLSATYSNDRVRTLRLIQNGSPVTGYSVQTDRRTPNCLNTIINLTAGDTLGAQLVNDDGNVTILANHTSIVIHFMSR